MPLRFSPQCRDLARAGVTTSTYGLGDGFNEELMIGMARHGQGSSYYGQTADDLMDPFREEFALLNALCARRLRLELDLAPGVTAKDDERLPFSVRYTTLDGEPRAIQPFALALPALPASAFHAIAEDELVARRAGELEAAYLQTKARAAARHGDWAGVESALRKAERAAANNPWVAESVKELRALAAQKDEVMFSKESAFAARRMSTRLAVSSQSRSSIASARTAPASESGARSATRRRLRASQRPLRSHRPRSQLVASRWSASALPAHVRARLADWRAAGRTTGDVLRKQFRSPA
jgi:Ca-activated chloride channel homolog